MGSSQTWFVPLISIVAAIGGVMTYLLVRLWLQRARLTDEERSEVETSPMTGLEKSAWWSIVLGAAMLAIIVAILTRFGATESWNNDALRLTVELIFVAGLAGYAILLALPFAPGNTRSPLDERDRRVLSRAPIFQNAFVVVTLALWVIFLSEHFRDVGAVPIVYLNLIFGSILLVGFIGHSIGILMSYRLGDRFGQG